MKQTQEEEGTLETQNAGGHNPGPYRDLNTQLHLMSRVRQNASSSFRWADLRTGAGCVGEDRTPQHPWKSYRGLAILILFQTTPNRRTKRFPPLETLPPAVSYMQSRALHYVETHKPVISETASALQQVVCGNLLPLVTISPFFASVFPSSGQVHKHTPQSYTYPASSTNMSECQRSMACLLGPPKLPQMFSLFPAWQPTQSMSLPSFALCISPFLSYIFFLFPSFFSKHTKFPGPLCLVLFCCPVISFLSFPQIFPKAYLLIFKCRNYSCIPTQQKIKCFLKE